MPLTWNIGKIEKFKDDVESAYVEVEEMGRKGYRLNPLTETLIFFAGATGIGEITASSAIDYYARGKVIEHYSGHSFMNRWGDESKGENPKELYDLPLAFQDVYDHIGLSTNHGVENQTDWVNRMVDNFNYTNTEMKPTAIQIKARLTIFKEDYQIWEQKHVAK